MAARRYDRRSRLAAAEETRRRIVRATAELHAERGCLGTTHAMIAERAGVSVPTVYKYFPTRNDLIPHCTGLVFSEAPVRLDETALAGHLEVPARLRALARRAFALYAYASPWLRWSARDAAELPALQAILGEAAAARAELVRLALGPGFPGTTPRRLVAVSAVLLDYPSWQSLTGAGYSSQGAATAVGDTLITLYESYREENR
jgi:AcrR family transcriptional regulator